MRVGSREPVYWHCGGEVFAYPSGEIVAHMERLGTARLAAADSAAQVNRKTFWYTDPETGDVLREAGGAPLAPTAYPYRKITYQVNARRGVL